MRRYQSGNRFSCFYKPDDSDVWAFTGRRIQLAVNQVLGPKLCFLGRHNVMLLGMLSKRVSQFLPALRLKSKGAKELCFAFAVLVLEA